MKTGIRQALADRGIADACQALDKQLQGDFSERSSEYFREALVKFQQ